MKRQTALSAFVLALTFASPAFAHTGHEVAGFAAGLTHPMVGLDHLLAMLAVGLWAGLVRGRSLWAWPASFVGAMLVGGTLAMSGVMLPGVEMVIATSVVALGVAVALGMKPQIVLGASLIALFGLAHGYAHGLEAPVDGNVGYVAGFVLATAALHGIGLVAVLLNRTRFASMLPRVLGGAVMLSGLALIAG